MGPAYGHFNTTIATQSTLVCLSDSYWGWWGRPFWYFCWKPWRKGVLSSFTKEGKKEKKILSFFGVWKFTLKKAMSMDTNQAGLVKISLSLIHGHNMRNNTTFKSNLVMSCCPYDKIHGVDNTFNHCLAQFTSAQIEGKTFYYWCKTPTLLYLPKC